jgi:hypothetical protein
MMLIVIRSATCPFCANIQRTRQYIRTLSMSSKFPSHLCTKNALEYSLCLTGPLIVEGRHARSLFESCHLKQTPQANVNDILLPYQGEIQTKPKASASASENQPMLRRNMPPHSQGRRMRQAEPDLLASFFAYFSVLKMEATFSGYPFYLLYTDSFFGLIFDFECEWTTRCSISEDRILQYDRCDNLKPHIFTYISSNTQPITVEVRFKERNIFVTSKTGTVCSNPTKAWMYVCDFLMFLLSCVGSGLAKGCFPVQAVLPTVCKIHNFKIRFETGTSQRV